MKIVLLDDDENFTELFCRVTAEIDGVEAKPLVSEDDFAVYLRNNFKNIDAVFMDIELKGSNGIDLASAINHSYKGIPIIFITGYPVKYCQEVFLKDISLTPFAFIAKPITNESISKVIEKLNNHINKTVAIKLKNGKSNIIVNTDEIIYIESNNKELFINTKNQTFRIHDKLAEFIKKLPDNFLSPHKSYIVNTKYIKEIQSNKVALIDHDTLLPISRSRKAEFLDKLIYIKGFSYDS